MNGSRLWIVEVLGMLLLISQPLACGGDDGGEPVSAAEACGHFCSCPQASELLNCQSTCVSGVEMATDPAGCARCTAESNCTELWNNSCETACTF